MKPMFKFQSKMILRSVAIWIIFAFLTSLILISSLSSVIAFMLLQDDFKKATFIAASSHAILLAQKILFFVATVFISGFICGFILYKYKTNGLNLIIQTKPVKRSTIFFTNYLTVVFYSFLMIFFIWLISIVCFSPIIFNSEIRHYFKSLFTFLPAALMVSLFLCSFGSLLSSYVGNKLFEFLIYGIPMILMGPLSIVGPLVNSKSRAMIEQNLVYQTGFVDSENNWLSNFKEIKLYNNSHIYNNNGDWIVEEKYLPNSQNTLNSKYKSKYEISKVLDRPILNVIKNMLTPLDLSSYFTSLALASENNLFNEYAEITTKISPYQLDISKLLTIDQIEQKVDQEKVDRINQLKKEISNAEIHSSNPGVQEYIKERKEEINQILNEFKDKRNKGEFNKYKFILSIKPEMLYLMFDSHKIDHTFNKSSVLEESALNSKINVKIQNNIDLYYEKVINSINTLITKPDFILSKMNSEDISHTSYNDIKNLIKQDENFVYILTFYLMSNFKNHFDVDSIYKYKDIFFFSKINDLQEYENKIYKYLSELENTLENIKSFLSWMMSSNKPNDLVTLKGIVKSSKSVIEFLLKNNEVQEIYSYLEDKYAPVESKLFNVLKEANEIITSNDKNKLQEFIHQFYLIFDTDLFFKIENFFLNTHKLVQKHRTINSIYKNIESIINSTIIYTYFKYLNNNNITVDLQENTPFIIDTNNTLFKIQEINNLSGEAASHYKVSFKVKNNWYISLLILVSGSILFTFLGNYAYKKKAFNI